jgi:hypothetical protein
MAKKKKSNPPLGPVARAELARLRNIQRNQYGAEGDQTLLKKLAQRVASGKRTAGQVEGRVRAGAATRDKLALRAGRTVQAELNPQIGAARNYEEGLRALYSKLAGQQSQAQGLMDKAQDTGIANIGNRYSGLASDVASQFRQGRENTSDELARLGLTGAISDGQSQAMENNMMGQVNTGRESALAQAGASAQGYDQLMSLLGQESVNTGAGLQAASSQQRGYLEASRPGKVYNLWGTLQDQKKAQDAESAQQAFLNKITGAKLGADTDYKRAQSLAELATARQRIVDSKRPSSKKVKRIN